LRGSEEPTSSESNASAYYFWLRLRHINHMLYKLQSKPGKRVRMTDVEMENGALEIDEDLHSRQVCDLTFSRGDSDWCNVNH